MGIQVVESKGLSWHHINQVDDHDLEQLQERFKFNHLDYDDIRAESPISKMDIYKHYLFFVFHIPAIDKESEHLYGEELYIFLSAESLVTITHIPIPVLEAFFERMQRSNKFRSIVLGKGTPFAMHKILAEVFHEGLSLLGDLTKEVHRLEEAIEHRHDKRLTVDLGHVRRNVLFLRHVIDPQRTMVTSLSNIKRSFISEDMAIYFDDVHDVLDTIWLSSDNLKLIIDGLFDVNEALLSHKTNEVVTLLTLVSAALMVPTLIAGFYGMNVPWLPYVQNAKIISLFYAVGFFGMLLIVLIIIKRPRS